MHIFYYNTPIYREILLQFLQFTENITSTERLFILDAVLKPCWGVQHAFQRRSTRFVLSRLKMVLYVDRNPVWWKSSGTPQHSTMSKAYFRYCAVAEQCWVFFSTARHSSVLDKINIVGLRHYKTVLQFDWCFSLICLPFVSLLQEFIVISLLIDFLSFCLLP